MTLTKAIEILNALHHRLAGVWFGDDINAIKLGIEALKQIKAFQEHSTVYRKLRLPGETED